MSSAFASGENSRAIFRSARRFAKFAVSSSTILVRSALSSGRKNVMSEMRFRNSGLKTRLASSSTFSRIFSASLKFIDAAPKPIDVWRWSSCAPTLLVMMMIVLRKSTVRPSESVRRPSSRICSRIWMTSGCAFSTSSKSTTAYGLRRTASVSWPPSS